MTPSNPKVKELVSVFEKELKVLTNNDAIVVLVFCAPEVPIEYDQIVDIVCKATEIPKEVVFNNTRKEDSVLARQLIAFFSKSHGRLTYTRIAKHFGVDHTTVMSNVQKVKNMLETGNGMVWSAVNKINDLIEQLKSAA